ncbi:MAG: GMP synthase [Chitinophagaceae bacterium]
MNSVEKKTIRVAILDLYEGQANQGMRCLRDLLTQYGEETQTELLFHEFDVRLQLAIPDLSYDFYISSGGPGSPLESEGSPWENAYFDWINQVLAYNNNPANATKKNIFFICHSFQLACRFFNVGKVCKRHSTAFGVFPIHLLPDGKEELVLEGLKDPFYSVDSRDYQVIEPNHQLIYEMGGSILAIEKDRPHVPLERAVMSIRFNQYMIGTQFHPEADATGMSLHLQTAEKKKTVIENHGLAKWQSMIDNLNDPDKIMFTYAHILPNFFNCSIGINIEA